MRELRHCRLKLRYVDRYFIIESNLMSIKVCYFASLKEQLGRADDELDTEGVKTVTDVWYKANAGRPLPDTILSAVNMEYMPHDAQVRDGDEVAFFPPVTGGLDDED